MTACIQCPRGNWTKTIGAAAVSDCSICALGFKNNGSQCVECTPGQYGVQENCYLCQPGKYSPSRGSSACLDCSEGFWSKLQGSSSKSSCSPCGSLAQVSCPKGSPVPIISSGVYRDLNLPGDIYVCIPPEACLSAGNSTTVCADAYTGFACHSCNLGFFQNSGKCSRCIVSAARWALIVICFFVGLFILYQVSVKKHSIPTSLKTALFWFQFLSLLPALSSQWSSSLMAVLSFSSVFNLDIGYFGITCDFAGSYLDILRMKIILPFLFMICAFGSHSLMFALKKIKAIPWLKVFTQTVVVTNFFSIQLFSSMFQVFHCVEIFPGMHVVSQSPETECLSSRWLQFLPFDTTFIFVYIIVLPSVLVLFFRHAKRSQDQVIMEVMFNPFLEAYRAGCEWFEIFRLLFRLCFVLIRDVLPISTNSKVAFLSMLLTFMIWIESKFRPYKNPQQQDLSLL
jgi:hypothetical protein